MDRRRSNTDTVARFVSDRQTRTKTEPKSLRTKMNSQNELNETQIGRFLSWLWCQLVTNRASGPV